MAKQKSLWVLEGRGIRCRAHTKSEARSEFKKILRLKRLPAGVAVSKVEE